MFGRLVSQYSRPAMAAMAPKPSLFMAKTTFTPMMQFPALAPIAPITPSPLITNAMRFIKTFRTYQPSLKKRKYTHGFLRRLKSRGGRHVVTRRREKGRWKVGV